MKRIVVAAGMALLLALFVTSGPIFHGASAEKNSRKHESFDGSERFVPGRVLVKFRSGIMLEQARNIIAALGARDADEIPDIGVHVLDLPYQASESAFVHAFQARSEVEFAELDRIVEPADVVPNDPWYAGAEWHLGNISAPQAWSRTTGNSGIVIAIIDSGVDANHEDLAGNMVAGWNIINNNANTVDVNGHGTNVAGAAAARSNNMLGVASVAWNCKIMPIRVSDANGSATLSNIASGLNWAANHGARVANISFVVSDSATVRTAAQNFQSKGGVVTVSAGNYSTFSSSPDNPYVLTVSASNYQDAHSDFSNYGNNVDLAAPEAVYTTVSGGGYMYAGGTSFSAPIVAGVAALMLSINPSLTGAQVQDLLKQNADDRGSAGWDMYFGWGRINAARAVNAAGGGGDTTAPTVSIVTPSTGATISGGLSVEVAANDNVAVTVVSLSVNGNWIGTAASSPYIFAWDSTSAVNGQHTLVASATDAAGNTLSCAVTINVSNGAPPGDTTPPIITIASPSAGSRVGVNTSVFVNATDDRGVVKNELYVDGVLVSTSTTAPFTTKWNSKKAQTGAHNLQCQAYDAAGNKGLSPVVTVYK